MPTCRTKHVKTLKNIKLLLLDVDGTMTDGRVYFDSEGNQTKAFNVKDGMGIKLLQKEGLMVGIISGMNSKCVQKRCESLGMDLIYQGIEDKAQTIEKIISDTGIGANEIAFMGDDINDLPAINIVGFSAAVKDASRELFHEVDFISEKEGGKGAVRDLCDKILEARRTVTC